MKSKARLEWVAFNERPLCNDAGTGRKVCVRVREIIYVIGDGNGSVIFLKGETEALGVTESIETVMERVEP